MGSDSGDGGHGSDVDVADRPFVSGEKRQRDRVRTRIRRIWGFETLATIKPPNTTTPGWN